MCNICRKIEIIKNIDSKLLKPIILILSKLHERIEPGLGDSLLRRETRIHTIRRHLFIIQKGPLRILIGAVIADLDAELGKIEVSKVNHPAVYSVGRLDNLKERIRPDESSSVRMRKTNKERECKDLNHVAELKDIPQNEMEQDLSMYDLHPHPQTIEGSIQLVEGWFAGNSEGLLSEGVSRY